MERVPGRHRRTLRLAKISAAAATATLVVAGGSWFAVQQFGGPDCTGRVGLAVAAATEIAPAVRTAADRWMADGAAVDGVCVAVTVTGVDPAAQAAAIARSHQVSLAGLGTAPGAVAAPDVWLPDSSTWLLRLTAEAPGFVPTDGGSVAQSPIVLGMPAPVAQQFGWPQRKLAWRDLLAKLTGGGELRPGIIDPARDAAGLAGLLALSGAAGSGATGAQQKVATLRALAANSSSIRDDLMQKFPRAADDLENSLSAAPLSEKDVVAYNKERPQVELAALYLDPAPAALNYPFAVLPEADPQHAAAASGLHAALRQAGFLNTLAAAGLRGPDGRTGTGFAAPAGAPGSTAPVATGGDGDAAAAAQKASGAISQLLGSWAAITLPGRVLAVFDISGSMKAKVPTAGGLSRAEVTRKAAAQGLALFDDQWAVGNWVFSTDLVGKRPWRELVPITPLSSARGQLAAAIEQIVPKTGGDTGLYDTALAAYKNVQESWQPGRVNSVILFTDGKNDNPGGLERGALLAQLKKLRDPKRPVRMVIVGIGTGVDRAELESITKATSSGGVFVAEDPARIGEIFLQAIATRSGA